MYYVYILRSQKLKARLYVGFTTDVDRRLPEHNRDKRGYTKQYAPLELEACVGFKNEKTAKDFERYLKSGSGFAFLKKRLLPNTHSTSTEKYK